MPRSKTTLKKCPSSNCSNSPKRIILFNNNINDIISKFENSHKSHIHYAPDTIKHPNTSYKQLNDQDLNICSAKVKRQHFAKQSKEKRHFFEKRERKMVDAINDEVIDNDSGNSDGDHNGNIHDGNDELNASLETDDFYESIESIDGQQNVYDFVPDANLQPTKFMRLRNMNLIRCQLNMFQRFLGILLSFPFFSSVNGAGLSTLTCAFFLPRILCENILYPVFRLILGTLYPAYASYKAVRNKDVKDYVSKK